MSGLQPFALFGMVAAQVYWGETVVDMTLAAEGEARRREILAFIEKYSADNGWAPSGAEIATAIGVSATAVSKHIRRLEAEGRLVRAGRLARGLHVVKPA